MYNIGTVTTTANSPKITGTGTRWKDNTTLISVGQVVLIENGANLLINSIYSIESNTALTLAFPLSAKLTNAKYIILTTMIDSISDGVNKATAQVIANELYVDILNQWMTAQGTIDVELPTGQKVKLRTVAEMDKQLDGKFDKAGGTVTSHITVEGNIQSNTGKITANLASATGIQLDGAGDIAKIRGRAKDGRWYDHVIPESAGTLMQVGDFGFGGTNGLFTHTDACAFIAASTDTIKESLGLPALGGGIQSAYNAQRKAQLFVDPGSRLYIRFSMVSGSDKTAWYEAYSTKNTTKDANGNLKAASPIVKVFADDIDVNDESEGVTLKKLHTGIYQLCGVLGMHSDASWGGINGGITIPSGINQLPLVYVDYDVLVAGERHPFNGEVVQQEEHGDIVIYTSYRKHLDLPQNVQYARLKTYPEFAREIDGKLVELEAGEPIDIPNGHWIDVRVNMPSNSLYNQKQAEAQRLAEIEAERLAKEEAERIAEEAKRAELEAVEQVEEQ